MTHGFCLTVVLGLCLVLAPAGCAQHERRDDRGERRATFDITPSSRNSAASEAADTRSTDARSGDARSDVAPMRVEVRADSASASATELIGKRCRVRFRRDALGVAGQAFVSPDADTAAPGRLLYVDGTIRSATHDAVVLRNDNDQLIWIPLGNVLMVETVK